MKSIPSVASPKTASRSPSAPMTRFRSARRSGASMPWHMRSASRWPSCSTLRATPFGRLSRPRSAMLSCWMSWTLGATTDNSWSKSAMTETLTASNPLRAGLRMQRTPEPASVVIFGATGDLTHRKLVPALYNLQRERLLPPGFSVIGFARRDWSDDFFRGSLLEDARQFSRNGVEETLWQSFAEGISYVQSSFDDPQGYQALAQKLNQLDE